MVDYYFYKTKTNKQGKTYRVIEKAKGRYPAAVSVDMEKKTITIHVNQNVAKDRYTKNGVYFSTKELNTALQLNDGLSQYNFDWALDTYFPHTSQHDSLKLVFVSGDKTKALRMQGYKVNDSTKITGEELMINFEMYSEDKVGKSWDEITVNLFNKADNKRLEFSLNVNVYKSRVHGPGYADF